MNINFIFDRVITESIGDRSQPHNLWDKKLIIVMVSIK